MATMNLVHSEFVASSATIIGSAYASAATAAALTAAGTLATQAIVATSISAGISYAYPALFPTEIDGRPLEEIPAPSATEGNPILYCAGPKNRIGGQVIWLPEKLDETVETIDIGKNATADTYKYSVNIAVALCEGPIETVTRVWANGHLLAQNFLSQTCVGPSDQLSIELFQFQNIPPFGSQAPGLRIRSSPTGPDLTIFTNGVLTTTSGFANPTNNGIGSGLGLFCANTGVEPDGSTFMELYDPISGAVPEAAGESANCTVCQSALEFVNSRTYELMEIHTGADDQSQSAFLETIPPLVGKFIAYRGIAWVYIKGLQLEDYGNRIPQLSFEVKQSATKSVGDVISDILIRGGLSSSEFDVQDLGDPVSGFVIRASEDPLQSLIPLLKAFNIVAYETSGGVLKFIKRGNEPFTVVDPDDLAAHEMGGDAPRPLSISEVSNSELPGEVTVNYFDAISDMNKSSQGERRINASVNTTRNINLPLTLTAGAARNIAARELWSAWINRQVVTLVLPPSYVLLQEQQVISIALDITYNILITKIDRGNNFVISIEGLIESVETLNYDIPGEDQQNFLPQKVKMPPFLMAYPIDIAPLALSGDIGRSVLYLAVTTISSEDAWYGASVYISFEDDEDADFVKMGDVRTLSTYGKCTSTLADGPTGYWDRKNTLTVEMYNGTLQSSTEVFKGRNFALVGQEIIAYENAVLTATNTYELTNLLRGIRNTEDKTSSHLADEPFVPLTSSNISAIPISTLHLGKKLYIRVVPGGRSISDVPSFPVTFEGRTSKPFSPCQVKAVRETNNDITLTFERRSLTYHRMFSPIPKSYWTENYKIEILDGSTVVRTITQTAKSYTYLEADQTSDGFSNPDTIDFKVYQKSDDVYGDSDAATLQVTI